MRKVAEGLLHSVKEIANAIRPSSRHQAIDASNLPDWLRRDIGVPVNRE